MSAWSSDFNGETQKPFQAKKCAILVGKGIREEKIVTIMNSAFEKLFTFWLKGRNHFLSFLLKIGGRKFWEKSLVSRQLRY